MTHPYSGHRQSLFADLSPAISQDDGYMLPQFGEEHIFEHAALVSSGRPAVNAEADALCFHHPSDQLLSPAPSSSPPFAIEYTGRQKPCQRAPPAQNFHNDSWVQANHRVDKRVKLSSPEFTLRPQRHKLRFTAEDDALLMYLKETNSHTWKQIAAYFPGRNPGTLQVRYCTRLKAKSTMWNDENVRLSRSCKLFIQQISLCGGCCMKKPTHVDVLFGLEGLTYFSSGPKAYGRHAGI